MTRNSHPISVLIRTTVALAVVVALGGAGAFYYNSHASSKPTNPFQTAAVSRGNVSATISATGTIEAEEVINVGAQVAGRIDAFGPDRHDPSKTVDYNSVVEKGDLLAEIDKTTYKAALEQAEAALQQSEANLLQLEAKARQAERFWKRAESLLPQHAIADTDYDTAQSDCESAKANVAVGKATIRQNKAAVETAKTNLNYCTIRSPVRGTIIDRRVNIGQTVVASLSAPSLFLIAKDLTKMQVWTSVSEGDIGRLRLGMPVQFTVDAHGDEVFSGKVTQIRMNAQMTSNVVTYFVIVTTDNSSGKLLPYLTANVQFQVESKSGVLVVPNAALRWTPESSQIDPSVDSKAYTAESGNSERHFLWVATERGTVRPVEVTTGVTDGTTTEVSGKEVHEGLPIVLGEKEEGDSETPQTAAASGGDTKNPFMPQPPKGSRPPPGPM